MKPSSAAHCSRPILKRQVLVEKEKLLYSGGQQPGEMVDYVQDHLQVANWETEILKAVTSCIILRLAGIKVKSRASPVSVHVVSSFHLWRSASRFL